MPAHDITSNEVTAFCDDAYNMANRPADEIFSLQQSQIDRIQLAGIRKRFSALTPLLPPLKKLAEQNHITAINEINELVPLLFPHTAYKSYPMSLIDNCRFSQLNAWLNDYTTHDLSNLDVSSCQTLDEWLDVIETKTAVRVITSSGTSGKISLIPRSTAENQYIPAYFSAVYSPYRNEPGFADAYAPHIYHVSPHVPKGRHISALATRNVVEYAYHGDGSHVFSPSGEMSTDLLWMTGRMRKAQTDGTVEQLKKTKAWQRLSDKVAELEAKKAGSLDDFYCNMLTSLRGKTVVLRMGLNYFLAMVEVAEKRGIKIDFATDSFITAAGGIKGTTPLTDAQMEKVRKALPFEFNEIYACSELMSGLARKCSQGHYHAPPWLVSFVLDPATGAPYPRQGLQTGRYAGFDLWATTYWGGFITGDEVTINWDGGCECGRIGPYLNGKIMRYSDKHGGDDKITCQRTAAAVDEMLQHLNAETSST